MNFALDAYTINGNCQTLAVCRKDQGCKTEMQQ